MIKRKSLFLIILTFFANIALGQGIVWPTSLDGNVKGVDTIYFCANSDSLFPIELGYDVANKYLSPWYGDWSLISKTSDDVNSADFSVGVAKNGGAGNGFRVTGSGIGGLLFQYKSEDDQCGLPPGSLYWIYVFNMPLEYNVIAKDTIVCKGSNGSTIKIDFNASFDRYKDLYAKAGFGAAWKHGGFPKIIRTDSIGTYVIEDTLILTKTPPSYRCGSNIPFKYTLKVRDTIGQLIPLSFGICSADTTDDLGKRNPNLIFKRNDVNGSYNPSTIADGTPWTIGSGNRPFKVYTFTYTVCPGEPTPIPVKDTLYIISSKGYWGRDTVIECREVGSASILSFYNKTSYGGGKPVLDETSSYWYERGLGTLGNPAQYGTVGNVPSLYDKTINLDVLKSNIAYNYLWEPDAGVYECLVKNNIVDSGTLVLIIKDPFRALDYTAQLCRASYGSGDKFDLNAYTGLTVDWKDVNDDPIPNPITIPSKGTYKYKYSVPPDCGVGGNGVFYLRVTDNIKTPASKTVKYCINKLPPSININDILGVSIKGLRWSSTLGAADGFDSITGILDVTKYAAKNGSNEVTLVFNVDTSGTSAVCNLNPSTKVTLIFTNDIIN
jgi:hypothetical protein